MSAESNGATKSPASTPSPESSQAPLARAAGAAVMWRAVGLAGAKVIAVARLLVLAWLLVPDDFGLFAMAFVPLNLLLGVTDVGMIPALVQRQDVHESDYHAAWTVGVVRGLAISLMLLATGSVLAGVFGDPRAATVIRVLALRPLIAATASIRVAALERDLRFRSLAMIDISGAAVNAVLAIALARQLGVWALVIGTLAEALTCVVASYVLAPHTPRFAFDRERARSLLNFGRWVLAGGVAAMIGEAVLQATISRTLGTGALGRYSLASNLALAPGGMVGALIGSVAFAVHARVFPDEKQVARVFRASVIATVVLLLPAYSILVAIAPALVTSLFDARWQGTAPVLQLLVVAGLLGLGFDTTTAMFLGAGRPRSFAVLAVIFSATVILLAWPLTRGWGLEGAATARIVADLAVLIGSIVLARTVLKHPLQGLAVPLGSTLVAAAAGAAAAGLIVRSSPTVGAVVGAGVAGLAVAGLLLWLLDHWLKLGIRRDSALVIPALRP